MSKATMSKATMPKTATSKSKAPKPAIRKTMADTAHTTAISTLSYDNVLDELQALVQNSAISQNQIPVAQPAIKNQGDSSAGKTPKGKTRKPKKEQHKKQLAE